MKEKVFELVKNGFEKGEINGALILSKRDDGYNYVLYSKTPEIDKISPFHPVMKINGAKIVSLTTKDNDTNRKFLFFLKPCEVRAAIELKKLNQIDLNNSIFVSYICPGVMEYKEGNNFNEIDNFLEEFKNGKLNESLRTSCKTCEYFCGQGADIVFDIFNENFVALTEKGKEFLKKIEIEFKDNLENSTQLEEIKKLREKNSKELLKSFEKEFKTEEKIIEFFDECIKCNNCREACPICYCRQCYFESETFKYYPDSIKRKFTLKSALRLPTDKILFHLGRVSHMATSCVGCGMCEDVCPMNIKVSQFFKYMGKNIQNTFSYTPGINREEPLPLLTFKEQEFEEIED